MSRTALQFTPAARGHLRAIGRYTEDEWGAEQRDRYLGLLYAGFEKIRKSPQSGKPRDDLFVGLRSVRIQKHIAYYFARANQVEIIGVLHERMDPARHLSV